MVCRRMGSRPNSDRRTRRRSQILPCGSLPRLGMTLIRQRRDLPAKARNQLGHLTRRDMIYVDYSVPATLRYAETIGELFQSAGSHNCMACAAQRDSKRKHRSQPNENSGASILADGRSIDFGGAGILSRPGRAAGAPRRISSAMLAGDSRTSSAKGACGRHERHDSNGMRLVTAASG